MVLEHRVLPLVFVLLGTANVLLIKYSDTLTGECSDGQWRRFQHPIAQTAAMFFGEFLCFLVYKIVYFFLQRRADGSENDHLITRGGREFLPMSFLLPAFLDAIASILLFSGLYLTYASSFQMLRTAAIIFVGIFSSMYLNQTLISRHWSAMAIIVCGIITLLSVDVNRAVYDSASLAQGNANAVLTGDLLIICAQIFHAAQFVYEEKMLKGANIPAMQAVGWQGIFGLAITVLLGVCMHFLPMPAPLNYNSHAVFDDFGDLFIQLRSNPWLLVLLILFSISCAGYNFAALCIVQLSSTTNRILADGVRFIFIWVIALLMEWEYINLLTVMSFIIFEMGVIAYRNAIFMEWYRSLLARIARRRYADLSADQSNDGGAVPTNRPADVI